LPSLVAETDVVAEDLVCMRIVEQRAGQLEVDSRRGRFGAIFEHDAGAE
jgi:hypothetical protein